jgi:hypothetical protein
MLWANLWPHNPQPWLARRGEFSHRIVLSHDYGFPFTWRTTLSRLDAYFSAAYLGFDLLIGLLVAVLACLVFEYALRITNVKLDGNRSRARTATE